MICNECETVAHCTSHGCIPKQPAPAPEERKRQARSADTWVHATAWRGLTDEERNHARHTVTYSQLAMTAGEWAEAVQIETEKRLKEKNT